LSRGGLLGGGPPLEKIRAPVGERAVIDDELSGPPREVPDLDRADRVGALSGEHLKFLGLLGRTVRGEIEVGRSGALPRGNGGGVGAEHPPDP